MAITKIKKAIRVTSLDDLNRQLKVLNGGKSKKEDDSPSVEEILDAVDDEPETEDGVEQDDDEATEALDIDDAPETEDGVETTETDEQGEEPKEQEDENNENGSDETQDDSEEIDLQTINAKIEDIQLTSKKQFGRIISLLEALMAANRIQLGLSESETPRVSVEKKKGGTLYTARGKLKEEVGALVLWLDETGNLKVTSKDAIIHKGTAVEQQLDIKGKIPDGDWIVVERKEKYYLVSTENFEDAEDVTPYEDLDGDNETTKGTIVNKKGIANKVRGYKLKVYDDCYKLTDNSISKPVKVFNAKWTSECDNKWPVKGNIPQGIWVIVYSRTDDEYYLVKSDDVEPSVSTKKTEKVEKPVKKVSKKVPAKKVVAKKIPAKKVASKKVAKKGNKKRK